MMSKVAPFVATSVALVAAADPSISLKTYVDSFSLDHSFNPVIEAYWTGLPHHRRTPFAVSPDGKTGYLAYLDSSGSGAHVQQVDLTGFTATGTTVNVPNVKEAGGLVAHNDGFALLGNEPIASTVANAPPGNTPVPAIYKYTSGSQDWKTFLGGPGVHESDGLSMAPDMNGDLVYSEEADLYGAYFVVTDYSGDAEGHYGDSIEYVNSNGTLETIDGATSAWGCSHNTGIAFEAADEAPFASICAEDQGAIWLNTGGTGMMNDGIKISNENTTNGGGGESMGGMSGSYSQLARFSNSSAYIFAWVSRGAVDLTENTWMGAGYTSAQNRTNGRRVAVALLTSKSTKAGAQATSQVGAASGDAQVNWLTPTIGPDRSNAHVAAFDAAHALVSWEQIDAPACDFVAMGCAGRFAGSYFQLVSAAGEPVGEPVTSNNTYVAGDMVTMSDGRICWPYVSMEWRLDVPVTSLGDQTTQKASFACMSLV